MIEKIKNKPIVYENISESIFRSYHILNYVKEMLKRNDSKETIIEMINYLENSTNELDKLKKENYLNKTIPKKAEVILSCMGDDIKIDKNNWIVQCETKEIFNEVVELTKPSLVGIQYSKGDYLGMVNGIGVWSNLNYLNYPEIKLLTTIDKVRELYKASE